MLTAYRPLLRELVERYETLRRPGGIRRRPADRASPRGRDLHTVCTHRHPPTGHSPVRSPPTPWHRTVPRPAEQRLHHAGSHPPLSSLQVSATTAGRGAETPSRTIPVHATRDRCPPCHHTHARKRLGHARSTPSGQPAPQVRAPRVARRPGRSRSCGADITGWPVTVADGGVPRCHDVSGMSGSKNCELFAGLSGAYWRDASGGECRCCGELQAAQREQEPTTPVRAMCRTGEALCVRSYSRSQSSP